MGWGSRHTPGQLAGGDPALAWAPGANVYYRFIGFNSVDCSAGGIYVSKSADAGATWETPVSVWPNADTRFQDKPYIAVDGNPGSPFFGRVYVSWTRFQNLECGGPMTGSLIVLSHSDDGETWSTPRTVSGPRSSCNQGSAPEVAADGSLYVAWWNCDTAPQRILAAKSVASGSIHLAWTDTRNGHQDIFTAAGTGAATDSDGDGCTDAQELAMGFDPFAWYDYFDVPVPANPDPNPNGPRDKAISMDDVLAVLFYFGTFAGDGGAPNPNGVAYAIDKDGDTQYDGLDYDRTPGATPNPPWEADPPDGAVSMDDAMAVLTQFGLDCVGPP